VSREGTILRSKTEPLSFDRSTSLIVIASTKATDGKGFPIDMGEPRSLREFPLKLTCVPGCDEAVSVGIFGCVVAQPMARNVRENRRNKTFT
jgi:hypothetical protein